MRSDSARSLAREAECVRLRLEGLDYDAIAEQVGYANSSGAWKAVRRALRREVAANVEEYRRLTLVDLDAEYERCWEAAMAGSGAAMDRLIRLTGQRMSLLDISSPTPTPSSTPDMRPRRDPSTWRERPPRPPARPARRYGGELADDQPWEGSGWQAWAADL